MAKSSRGRAPRDKKPSLKLPAMARYTRCAQAAQAATATPPYSPGGVSAGP